MRISKTSWGHDLLLFDRRTSVIRPKPKQTETKTSPFKMDLSCDVVTCIYPKYVFCFFFFLSIYLQVDSTLKPMDPRVPHTNVKCKGFGLRPAWFGELLTGLCHT